MGRKKINEDEAPGRFPAGTLDRIDKVRAEYESQADFLRVAVERELLRREGTGRRRRATDRKTSSAGRQFLAPPPFLRLGSVDGARLGPARGGVL